MAEYYEKSDRTIRRWLKKYGISLREIRYTAISNKELKRIIKKEMEMGHEYGKIVFIYRFGGKSAYL